jgi:site-specific DNA recombinase
MRQNMKPAAIYCRSSKDKAELGIDIQERELAEFAASRGMQIVARFSDMEISGSLDETARPGLRQLLAAIKDEGRGWDALLAVDTSRIARDPMIALYVQRECEKAGVVMHFAKLPIDGQSAFGETMLSVVRAFDRLHSRLSKEKGRAGLEANVANGHRAGGRAPIGYGLKHEATGAMRGGQAVKKSKLERDPATADKVRLFLAARAEGIGRTEAATRTGLKDKAVASLIAIERNALTYAGHTVWNQRKKIHGSRDNGIARQTMTWNPREEWKIARNTHEAFISDEDAEKVLALHEERLAKPVRVAKPLDFILSGLLFTPAGVQWHGDAHDKAYRAGQKGKRINAPWIEGEVLKRIAADFEDEAFLAESVNQARQLAEAIEADPKVIDIDIKRREKQIRNLVDMAAETGDRRLLKRMQEMERELAQLRQQKADWLERRALKQRLMEFSANDIRYLLQAHGIELGRGEQVLDLIGYGNEYRLPPGELRRVVTTLIERIEIDPLSRVFSIQYRLPVTGVLWRPHGDSNPGSYRERVLS